LSRLVYVVDDEPLLAQIMEAILQHEGFVVKAFFCPKQAWDAFQAEQHKPELLITDFVMQPFNGLDLLARCRSIHPEVRSVVVSGNVGAETLERHPEKPDAFLAKPFMPDKLVSQVSFVLRRA
jgi:DNA-binding NtrC family response regulator